MGKMREAVEKGDDLCGIGAQGKGGSMNTSAHWKQQWFILTQLTKRELKRRYARSYLGVLWSVLHPLLSMLLLSFLFSGMFRRSIENYPIYYLSGYLIWQTFATASTTALTALADNRALLLKAQLSLQLLILARVYTAFVNLAYSFGVYLFLLLVFGIPLHPRLLLALFLFALLFLFSLGISYLLAGAYVFFGDVKHLYSVLLTLWMYCSALFYPASQLEGFIAAVVAVNPLFCFIDALRTLVLQAQTPSLAAFALLIVYSVGAYGVGSRVFRSLQRAIAARL